MIPIVFPHTYLSRRVMQILTKVFDRIGVYLPSNLDIPEQMQRWADSDMLDLRIPVTGDAARLAEVLKAFRSWASMQGSGPGFDLNLLKAYHSQPPFFDAPFASQIRTDIGRRVTPPSSKGEQTATPDRLLSARIFLSVAQQLDEQADTLDQDFAAVYARQQDMLAELQDSRAESPSNETPTAMGVEVHGLYMLAERLQAWAMLAAADVAQSGQQPPALFSTTSREVLERVVDRLPDAAAVGRSGAISVPVQTSDAMAGWRRDFLQAVTALATDSDLATDRELRLPYPPPVAGYQDRLQVEVIRIPHMCVTDVLDASPLPQPAAGQTVESTVIVAVESAGNHET